MNELDEESAEKASAGKSASEDDTVLVDAGSASAAAADAPAEAPAEAPASPSKEKGEE